MIQNARGLLCMPVIGERLTELNIPLMVDAQSSAKHGTAFTRLCGLWGGHHRDFG